MPKTRNRAFIAGPEQAHQHFKMGIDAIANLLAPTLGPTGGAVANQQDLNKKVELLDDAATVVRRILSLGDPRLDVGAMLMRNLVWQVTGRVGDGGASTAVLTRALYHETLRLSMAGVSPVWIERGVQAALAQAIDHVRGHARPTVTEDELSKVALTIVRERPLAALLGEMSYLLGADARINVEKYVAPYLERTYFPGANYEAQIASYELYTDKARKRAVLGRSAVALVDAPLASAEEIVALMEAALAAGKPSLIVVAHAFKETALHTIVRNQAEKKRKLSVMGATLKAVGDNRRHAFDDLALLTGATVLGRGFTPPAKAANASHLGTALRVEIGTKTLQLLPEQRQNPAVQEQIAHLRTRLDALPQDDEERANLTRRLSALAGGMGILKVGASTKTEREVRAENAERALKALSAAQKGGVVPGGGAAFLHAASALEEWSGTAASLNEEEAMGARAVARALAAPFHQIVRNAGVESPASIAERVRAAGPSATYDVFAADVVDAWQTGILDVADVLVAVLQTAASGAMMALSTDTIVYHRNPKQSLNP